jgi:hypothetical protein
MPEQVVKILPEPPVLDLGLCDKLVTTLSPKGDFLALGSFIVCDNHWTFRLHTAGYEISLIVSRHASSICIPRRVEVLPTECFPQCPNLSTDGRSRVFGIGGRRFSDCSSLSTTRLSAGLLAIGEFALPGPNRPHISIEEDPRCSQICECFLVNS